MSTVFADSMNTSQIIIRKAVTNDVPAIVKMWREMWDYHTRLDPRFTTSGCANEIMEKWLDECIHNERALVVVAEEQLATPNSPLSTLYSPLTTHHSIIGYCLSLILENPPVVTAQFYGYVSDLAVVESHRKKGVGRMLLDETHKWFKDNSVSYAEINVSVYNAEGRQFWLKHGYKLFLDRMRVEL